MSETPRTEKHCICGDNKALCVDCLFELSCKLETELAEAQADIERKDKLIEQMQEALEKIAEIGRQKGDARPQDAVSCFLIAEEAIKAANGEYEQ